MTRASVLIPTHNHHLTLPMTVATVLAQTVRDLEVILIGDGVTDQVREVAQSLVAADSRVIFMDRPKGVHHGEPYRHEAIEMASSDAIFYLCDDDLLLPDHVSDLLELLEDHNFVQCMNSMITTEGELRILPSDLSIGRIIHWHVTEQPFFNSTSLTGTAHSRSFYLQVGDPWEVPSDGCPPDAFQWRKLMRHSDFRGATSTRVTALQLPTSMGREKVDQSARSKELQSWAELVAAPDAQTRIDELVIEATRVQLVETFIAQEKLSRSLKREWGRPSKRAVQKLRGWLGKPNIPPYVD